MSAAAGAPASLIRVAHDLDRDLLDRQRDRRLGLGRSHPHRLGLVVAQQTVRDRRAQALERLVGALLGDERDRLADLAVVDGVLDAVSDGRVAGADLDPQVDHEALADLALGLGHAVMRVERQAGDLDRDERLRGLVLVLISVLEVLVLELLVVLVAHRPRTVAAATASASATGATSWTRKTAAPRSSASTFVAIVPASRSSAALPVRRPRNDLREVPITSGRPSATSSSKRRSSSRLCSTVLPKPMPGSSMIRCSAIPAATAASRRCSRNAFTSDTTSS